MEKIWGDTPSATLMNDKARSTQRKLKGPINRHHTSQYVNDYLIGFIMYSYFEVRASLVHVCL